jgi:quercetin dioxygenase-like cupin family protein
MIPDEPLLTTSAAYQVEEYSWGKLMWAISGALGNSEQLTVGWCLLAPGQANPRHYHPNCDEVLVVVEGRIVHSWNSKEIEMSEGDLISLPQGVIHNARNIDDRHARLLICFSSADRQTVSAEEIEA